MERIVTLTTDFGLKDPYTGIMKGVILSINPTVKVIDISHFVSPQNILEGAIVLSQAYHFFPKGTIHVVVVDPGVGGERIPVAIETEDYTFVGPDNGIFSLILEKERVTKIVHLTNKDYFLKNVSTTFHGRDIFAPVSAHLCSGVRLDVMGKPISKLKRIEIPLPTKGKGIIRGEVIYIDSFGNLITNISGEEIRSLEMIPNILITIGRYRIKGISSAYTQGEEGVPISLIGSSGYLEIACYKERASDVLHIKKGERIEVTGYKYEGSCPEG